MQSLKPYNAKSWLQTLFSENGAVNILDVWNFQQISKDGESAKYQISIRTPAAQVEKILRLSMPGRVQTNVPGDLRAGMSHVWLKNQEGPLSDEAVKDLVSKCTTPHLGCFYLRGTWALRAENQHIAALRQLVGRDISPAYLLEGCTSDWDAEDVKNICQQIGWSVTVADKDHRWKKGGRTWLVRSDCEPPLSSFPVNFGYERLQLRVSSTRKTPMKNAPPAPSPPPCFKTWGAQFRNHTRKEPVARGTFKDALLQSPPSKRTKFIAEVKAPMLAFPNSTADAAEAPANSQSDGALLDELRYLRQQNQTQNAQIADLLQQVSNLTAQLQRLTSAEHVPVQDADMKDL